MKAHLDQVDEGIRNLGGAAEPEQLEMMRWVVRFLEEHIRPHAAWEERVLYPAVDKRAASGPNPFTASMRYEHRVIARWMGELATESVKPRPDAKAFARRADNLLGLLWAHFEEEEEILLPILDASMSHEELMQEIGTHAL
jgi:hemerythrin-like domain-containing protein